MIDSYLADALLDCERHLETPPKWRSSCAMVSQILHSTGQEKTAYLWRLMSREEQPSRLSFHIQAGLLFAQLKKWNQAIFHNQKALEIKENLSVAYYNLAQIYRGLGQRESWLENIYKYTALHPEQTSAEDCKSLAAAFLKLGDIERTINCYQWATENDPKDTEAYYNLAALLKQSQGWEAAAQCYQRLLEADPQQAEARQKLGLIWVEQGEREAAMEQFQSAIALQPQLGWSHQNLVKLLMAEQQWEAAIAACQAALEATGSELLWAYRTMAKALIESGAAAKTVDCHRKLCKLTGWPEAEARGYHFTRDAMTYQMPLWQEFVQALAERAEEATTAIQALEVGVAQGMGSCWLLDQVLVRSQDRLVCIDPNFTPLFQKNIAKAEPGDRVTQLHGQLWEVLDSVTFAPFDLVILQHQRREAEQYYRDALESWPLLKSGGRLLVRHYAWSPPGGLSQSPKAGIERFLAEVEGEFEVLHQEKLLILQKLAEGLPSNKAS